MYQIVSTYFLNGAFKVFFFVSEPDSFGLASSFFLSFVFSTNRIFSRINNLTIQTRTTTLQNKYSYRNAVKRSINTSCTPLITLINGSRLWLHSYVKKYKSTFFVIFPKVAVVSRKVADIPKVCGDCSNFMS